MRRQMKVSLRAIHRSSLSRAPLIAGAAFGLLLCAEPAIARAPTRTATQRVSSCLALAGVDMPEMLAGLRRGDIRDYEVEEAGLGQSVAYYGPEHMTATVYMYDRRQAGLRDEGGRLAKAERDTALDDIAAFVRRGTYDGADLVSKGDYRPSRSPLVFASAWVRLVKNGMRSDSFVYVTVAQGKFLKIRITGPERAGNDAAADAFAGAVAQLVSN